MKRLSFLILFALIIQFNVSSQPCLPNGITFSTQAEIDSFQINYPNCTEIQGRVEVKEAMSGNITNLNGLNVLTSIGGSLELWSNDSLINLTGLDNVTSIGALWIPHNNSLTSLAGLDNVTSIGGDILIWDNDALSSLAGLDNVTSIGGFLWIRSNDALTSLTGLNNVTSIGGYLQIYNNDVLTSLSGLDNVTSIGGDLYVIYNDSLSSLAGLDNINALSINDLHIYDNTSLSVCEIQSVCDYLSSPMGSVNIYENASGCNNPIEVANACSISLPCLPYGNYYFNTQNEIDNFQINYPNCNEIKGGVSISGNSINNLIGLDNMTSIGGSLSIGDTDSLMSLTGLDNVDSIGGYLNIWYNATLTNLTELSNVTSIGGELNIRANDALTSLTGLDNIDSIGGYLNIWFNAALTSLTGLDNVTSIGGNFKIWHNGALKSLTSLDNVSSIEGYLDIYNNYALTSLTGLGNVTFIGGYLWIHNNPAITSLTGLENLNSIDGRLRIEQNFALTSLTGLGNIAANSITDLSIRWNDYLSYCEIQSICDYLGNPNSTIEIHYNATGCNTQQEVQDACDAIGITDINVESEVLIYPNPANKELFITTRDGIIINELNIYNQLGQRVLHETRLSDVIDVSMLRKGMYVIELVSDKWTIREKLIIR